MTIKLQSADCMLFPSNKLTSISKQIALVKNEAQRITGTTLEQLLDDYSVNRETVVSMTDDKIIQKLLSAGTATTESIFSCCMLHREALGMFDPKPFLSSKQQLIGL